MHNCFHRLKLITKTLFVDYMITVSRIQRIPNIDSLSLMNLYIGNSQYHFICTYHIVYKSEPIFFWMKLFVIHLNCVEVH